MKVLLVDDHPLILSALQAMIQDLSSEERSRLETRLVPGRTLVGFESMETQEALISAVVEFATSILAPEAVREEPLQVSG